MRRASLSWLCAGMLGTTLMAAPATAQDRIHSIRPSELDSAVRAHNDPHLAIPASSPDAPLALYLPGTGGNPQNTLGLLKTLAGLGYAVIGLEYENEPAVIQVCPRAPNPACSSMFREMRLYGTGASRAVSNTASSSIVGRLTLLLQRLDRDHPAEGWGSYLKDGAPDWSRLTVGGLSQGAGMAAYLAKQKTVARVVLFSSPYDYINPGRQLAPWLAEPSATPPERWYAAYDPRESDADLLTLSYKALRVPADHVRVFNLDLPPGTNPKAVNPYHSLGVRDSRYANEWRFLFGRAAGR